MTWGAILAKDGEWPYHETAVGATEKFQKHRGGVIARDMHLQKLTIFVFF